MEPHGSPDSLKSATQKGSPFYSPSPEQPLVEFSNAERVQMMLESPTPSLLEAIINLAQSYINGSPRKKDQVLHSFC